MGRSGGILGGFKVSRFDILDIVLGRYYIKVTLQYLKLQRNWNLVLVYGAAQEEDKEAFLVELGEVFYDQRLPILIGGDLIFLDFLLRKIKR
jgi:hypothetical protein